MSLHHHHHHHHQIASASTAASTLPSCFRPSASDEDDDDDHPSPISINHTTSIYNTRIGLFSLSWSSSFLGHSLRLNLHPTETNYQFYPSPLSLSKDLSLSSLTFNLHLKPWKKSGSKKLTKSVKIFWDFTKAKFGYRPGQEESEPESGFYVAAVVDGELSLLVGDRVNEAYSKTKSRIRNRMTQNLVMRRENIIGNRVFMTRTRIGGKNREIGIRLDSRVDDNGDGNDSRLCFNVDERRVLQIKRLKWKFRGSEKIDIDGVQVQISWDVHSWFFDSDPDPNQNPNHTSESSKNVKSKKKSDGYGVFMFRFENSNAEVDEEEEDRNRSALARKQGEDRNGVVLWKQRMKRFLMSNKSSSTGFSSSVSMSSGGSFGSSVMEWASGTEESELCGFNNGGFSLLVYGWRRK